MNDEQRVLRERQLELGRPTPAGAVGEDETLVGFRSGRAALAVPLVDVVAIRWSAPPTPLPEVPRWLRGIVALEGVIVPVVAADVLLGYADSAAQGDVIRIAVLGTSSAPLVALALEVLDGPIAASAPLESLPAGSPPSVVELARGLVDEHLLLDVPALAAALHARVVPLIPVEAEQRA